MCKFIRKLIPYHYDIQTSLNSNIYLYYIKTIVLIEIKSDWIEFYSVSYYFAKWTMYTNHSQYGVTVSVV